MLRHVAVSLVLTALPGTACILTNPAFDDSEGRGTMGASTDVDSASGPTATGPTATGPTSTGPTATGPTASGPTSTDSTAATSTPTEPTAGSSTTSGSDTGESESDSDATTSRGATCGDGSVDPGEDCDDGNLEDGDACSALCHITPTGINLVGGSTTAKSGMGAWTAEPNCGQALVDFVGRVDDNPILCRPALRCSQLMLGADLSVITQGSLMLGPFGDNCFEPSTSWERTCPAGHAVIGFSGRAGSAMDQLQPRCAPIQIAENPDGFTIGTGPVLALEPVGGEGGDPFGPLDCPANAIAVGANLAAGSWLEVLQLKCQTLELSFD